MQINVTLELQDNCSKRETDGQIYFNADFVRGVITNNWFQRQQR